eukprot:360124-Chlamydomonas_euryale.AAC.4
MLGTPAPPRTAPPQVVRIGAEVSTHNDATTNISVLAWQRCAKQPCNSKQPSSASHKAAMQLNATIKRESQSSHATRCNHQARVTYAFHLGLAQVHEPQHDGVQLQLVSARHQLCADVCECRQSAGSKSILQLPSSAKFCAFYATKNECTRRSCYDSEYFAAQQSTWLHMQSDESNLLKETTRARTADRLAHTYKRQAISQCCSYRML